MTADSRRTRIEEKGEGNELEEGNEWEKVNYETYESARIREGADAPPWGLRRKLCRELRRDVLGTNEATNISQGAYSYESRRSCGIFCRGCMLNQGFDGDEVRDKAYD